MPIVNIQITREGTLPEYTRVTREQKAQLIEGVSKVLLDVLGEGWPRRGNTARLRLTTISGA
jgi:phenylpyruvate tautomerase PptA (4-oxalocrotonate tautomerase family)